ncbi:MAG: VCBS repeat-containing protein, partial [Planctomycetes bacterium]|nr:VCBS repeat-containing protein [Planctomycetota bacterium]
AYSDLVVVNHSSDYYNILTGNGDGSYTHLYGYDTGEDTDPIGIVAGEFDGDGTVDLAIIYEGKDKVCIFHGYGIGLFTEDACYDVGDMPSAIKTGDFDNDGITDLVVANFGSKTLTILYGEGDGDFSDFQTISCGNGNPTDVLVTRLDWDSTPDLVVALCNINFIATYIGSGNKSSPFTAGDGADLSGSSPVALTAGLFNADSAMDVAVVVKTPQQDEVMWLFGNGAGALVHYPWATHAVGDDPVDVVVGSFNKDEDDNLDLVVACEGSQALYYLKGSGTGYFYSPIPIGLGFNPTSIAVAHSNSAVDENEYLDLAVTVYDPANNDAGYVLSIPGAGTGFDPGNMTVNGLGQEKPIDLVAVDFHHQFTDTYLLPRGRNCGYGLLILPKPVEEPYVSDRAYLFVTNHTVDDAEVEPTYCPDPQSPLSIDGKDMADIVTVYEINPNAFTPTDDHPCNDKLVASIRVGCGPQGIAASPDGKYIYVSNAYDGTISVINYSDCAGSKVCLLEILSMIIDPSEPIEGDFLQKIILNGASPTLGDNVINRSISTFSIFGQPSESFAWVTMSGYDPAQQPQSDYPGSLILLNLSDPWNPSVAKRVGDSGEIGEFTTGVATIPEEIDTQAVVVSDGHPVQGNGKQDSIAFIDSYNLINKCPGFDDQACFDNFIELKTLTDGEMGSSISYRNDGHRAYVFRDA